MGFRIDQSGSRFHSSSLSGTPKPAKAQIGSGSPYRSSFTPSSAKPPVVLAPKSDVSLLANGTPSIPPLDPKGQNNPLDVRHAQNDLIRLGCLPPDAIVRTRGTYDGSTKLAVQRFQAANHLPETGVIDPKTAAAMNAATALLPPGPKTKGEEAQMFVQFYQDHPQFDHFKDGCNGMVSLAYEFVGAKNDKVSNSIDAGASLKHFQDAGLLTPYDPNHPPPPGAIVFWPRTDPNHHNAHIVISTGAGNVISTGWGKTQGVASWSIEALSGLEGAPCAGWVAPPPEFNDPVI